MTTLPSGNITYLFTDIEGSTRLWEQFPDSMRRALSRHDEIIGKTVEANNGMVVRSRGEGDSFFAVFTSAVDAVAAACAIQLNLGSEDWPLNTPIRVRMALHTGESEFRENDYYGSVVNRCARLRAIAHGGQTVVSSVTASLAMDSLPESASLKSLGMHILRDVQHPEEVYQLDHPELSSEFPPLKSLEAQVESHRMAFVGRQREMGTLRAALGDVQAGRGRIVMLAGEPGIGKTRMAEELARIAEDQGFQVLWGRSHEDEGAPPYWPWTQPITSYVQDKDAEQLRVEAGAGAADMGELVPELKTKLPDLEQPLSLDPQQARFRMFNSLAAFLRNMGRSQPLLFVLDDLHWADRSSLQLLEFVSQEMAESRVMLVGTYRDVEVSEQHPLTDSLAQLTRERSFQRIALGGLDRDDVGQFIDVSSGITPPARLVDVLHAETEGNPLFVSEMVRLLVQQGELNEAQAIDRNSWDIRVPDGVREVIGRRLNRLSEVSGRILTTASVVGREFEFELLSMLSDVSEDDLLDVIDEALDARLIDAVSSGIERYQFSHALIQQTLGERLSPSRRIRLHARICGALENLYGDAVESHASELAYHYTHAQTLTGVDNVVKYSLIAGEQALDSYAYDEALVHFERALAAKEGQPMDAETASILFGLAKAQLATYEIAVCQEAVDTLRRAYDAFVDLGDAERAVAAATYRHRFVGFATDPADMATRALELVPSDSIEAGYLFDVLGLALLSERKDYEGARESYDKAIDIARREGDRILEVRTLRDLSSVNYYQERWSDALEDCLPTVELAQSLGELGTLVNIRNLCTLCLINLGDGDEAQVHATLGLEEAERLNNAGWLVNMLSHNATLAILRGEWDAAQEFIARTLSVSPRADGVIGRRALLNLQLGNLEESREGFEQVLELVPDVWVGLSQVHADAARTIPLFARVTGTTDLLDDAESVARKIVSSPATPEYLSGRARVGLALIAIQRDDTDAARQQYSILEPQRGTQAQVSICYDRLLGLLAQTIGNLDAAQSHFDDAIVFSRKSGYTTELAWSLFDYADMLLERGNEGDGDRAKELLDESLAISTELGMKPLMERVASRLEALK